jgi:hypothetical protein
MIEVIFILIQNTVGICKQTATLIIYHGHSRLVAFELIHASIQVSNICVTISLKFINFIFQIFPLLF